METDPLLFDLADLEEGRPSIKFGQHATPLWTKNKAKFIARYLKTFTYVTKHGTYIDAFAGPQHQGSKSQSWAAKLVMENEPRWLRTFHLFDKDDSQIRYLKELRSEYLTSNPKHSVSVYRGDCNETIPQMLAAREIREKEATFCLFDQRSTECDWSTVESVANYKGKCGGHKIEIFYFLAQGWIDRAIKSWKNDADSRCQRWFGKTGVREFLELKSFDRGQHMAKRFKTELGYRFACPFPIQKDGEHGRIMFWMIHASDHQRAPQLMNQAYGHIGAGGGVGDPVEQMDLPFEIRECENAAESVGLKKSSGLL